MFVFVSKGKFYSSSALARVLYQQLGQFLCKKDVFAVNITPESFAEIRIYVENFSDNFQGIYHHLPRNIFKKPLKKIEELEVKYWKNLFADESSITQDRHPSSECTSYYLPNDITYENTFDFKLLFSKAQKTKVIFEETELFQKISVQDSFFYNLGYKSLGPVFCAYGLWVNRLSSDSLLWGLMRDGEFLSKVCSELGADIGGNLYISRMSSIRAAMANVDDQDILKNFLLRSHTDSLKMNDAIDLMGVSKNSELPIDLDSVISAENLDTVIQWANRPLIKEQRYTNSVEMLNKILKHLNRSEVPADEDLVLLDLGYAGNILSNLNSIFKYAERQQVCRGRFVFSSVGSIWAQKNDCEILGGLVQNGAPYDFATLYYRSPELLELCCAPRCGTTVDYYEDGTPICAPTPLPEWQYREIGEVQQGILQFVKDWKDTTNYSSEVFNYKKSLDEILMAARQNLSRLIGKPTLEEAEKIGRWLYDHNAYGDLFSLAEPRSKDFDFKRAGRSNLYWPQAYKVLYLNG